MPIYDYKHDDLNASFNYYVSSTLARAQSANDTTGSDEIQDGEETSYSSTHNKTLRELFCLRGGTLCEIIKLNKRPCHDFKLSDSQDNSQCK